VGICLLSGRRRIIEVSVGEMTKVMVDVLRPLSIVFWSCALSRTLPATHLISSYICCLWGTSFHEFRPRNYVQNCVQQARAGEEKTGEDGRSWGNIVASRVEETNKPDWENTKNIHSGITIK
jgi:hypothetical protein